MKYRGWLLYLIGGTVLSLAAAWGGSEGVIAVVTQLTGWSSVAIGLRIAARSRREVGRPWIFFALAASAFLVAGIARAGHGLLIDEARPFPSPADAIALGGHVMLIVGSTMLGHLRSPDRHRAAIIDGAIIAVALQTIVWAALHWPYMTDSSFPTDDRLINGVYALMTMVVLATIGRLGVGPGARTVSYRLLAGAVFMIFVQDVLVTMHTLGRATGGLNLSLAPLIFVLFGAAALHPDRLRIAEAADRLDVRLTGRRVGVLIGALLVNPLVIGFQIVAGAAPTLVVAVVSTIILTLLVLARFVLLARSQERAVEVQCIQREANADLASASSRHAMYRTGLLAAMRLSDTGGTRVSLARATGPNLRIVDAIGTQATSATGTSVSFDHLPGRLLNALADLRPAVVDGVPPIDLRPPRHKGEPAVSVLVVPLLSHSELTGAMVVTTAKPIAATLRQSVETLASTVALALESAALTEDLLRRKSERRFRALVEHSSDIVLVVNEVGVITFASPASHRLLGLTGESMVDTHPARWLHPEDWPILASLLDGSTEKTAGDDAHSEVRLRHVDSSYRWFELQSKDLHHDPEIQGRVVTAREITDRKAAEDMLASSEARFRALVQHSSDVVAVVDGNGTYTYVSPAVTEMLGYRPEDLEGASAVSLVDPTDLPALMAKYPTLLPDEVPETFDIRRFEAKVLHRSGERRTLDVSVTDMRNEPAIGGVVLNARDVTVRKALEHDLHHQALHDNLTGLANRAMFTQRTAEALASPSGFDAGVGALFVDLDDFKTVNDSLGHSVGDQLLRQVADRLNGGLAEATLSARLGGDEFALLVVGVDEDELHAVGERVLSLVDEPFLLDGREINLTCSVGIAMASGEDDADAKELLRSADVAMYVAKERGKNCVAMFEERLHASVFERLEMKADLVRAVEDGQLRCHYQPIVSLQTGRITGVETLVRWQHPERGLLGPDAFIPLAEDTGLIVALGRWVLREACHQLRQWQLQLPPTFSLTISVNVSVRQLASRDIVADVRQAIDDAQIDPSTLTLEITETSLMHDTEVTRHRLAQLRELGVSLAVDDFGTGYSSLQYVQRFPIDVIKIDQSFVTGLGNSTGDRAVVQSMIELSQRLGVHTVAEGIETPEQLTLLQSLGADLGQGYWFSRPVPSERIDALLAADPTDSPRFSLR